MMEKHNSKIWQIIGGALIISIGVYWLIDSKKQNPSLDIEELATQTPVMVASFYDGQEGYSVSVPGGNSSTCIWTSEGGNASVPWSQTTQAVTATEKHTVRVVDMALFRNWKVTCVDDFGNQYIGIFPSGE